MAHTPKLQTSFKIKKLRTIYILYWFLLTYITAALVWWFIALSQQNKIMTDYKLSELSLLQEGYQNQVNKILNEKRRKTGQYIGEGVTFFLLIIVGAVLVFRAVRRRFRQSQQQQNFMMTITHELKTPIAITKLNLETLQKHRLTEVQMQQLISNTLQETGRMNTLCNNLLLASQIAGGDYTLAIEKINISELITESVNDFKVRFPKRVINFEKDFDLYLNGDRLLLQMAVNNLLDNAIKYSLKEERVDIELKENKDIKLIIKDGGKGIPDDEKNKIFDKFYRIGNLHTSGAKGTGLGLYLTKKIVEQHGGNIVVKDNNPHGSIFEVKL